MRRSRHGRLLLVLGMLAALGCDPGADDPKEPVWGKQACAHCAMLLSDQEHAAQAVTATGERLYFDDLGCLVAWTIAQPTAATRRWVRATDTRTWVAAETAGYERRARTPMGFGIVAVSGPGELDWNGVVATVGETLRRRE